MGNPCVGQLAVLAQDATQLQVAAGARVDVDDQDAVRWSHADVGVGRGAPPRPDLVEIGCGAVKSAVNLILGYERDLGPVFRRVHCPGHHTNELVLQIRACRELRQGVVLRLLLQRLAFLEPVLYMADDVALRRDQAVVCDSSRRPGTSA